MSFLNEFRTVMLMVASKRVTRTDINKGAYVPNAQQRRVMSRAGISPVGHEAERLIDIHVAGSDQIIQATYYPSVRHGSGRTPEIRMGRGLVRWIDVGEKLWLGTDGNKVFALKESSRQAITHDENEIAKATEQLVRTVDPRRVLEVARGAMGGAKRRESRSVSFERNPAVREFARRRSGGHCEMPGCDYEGFEKSDGTQYIEVHHIESLANDGDDVISNVAAICPNCHARAHHARDRQEIQSQLLEVVRLANERYLSMFG